MPQTRPLALRGGGDLLGAVPRRPVPDVIAAKLASLIASGVLAVGDALPGERDLASSLSVSRATVRGAIDLLARQGVLRVAHGARTTVARSDVSSLTGHAATLSFAGRYDLESVHGARRLIEQQVVAEAALRITPQAIGALETSMRAQERCCGDPVRFLLCDRDFHGLIYRACGNPLLADLAMDLYNFLLEHRRRIVAQPHAIADSIGDHHAILATLQARDAAGAVAAFARHEQRIYETTRAFLAGTGSAGGTGA